MENDFLEYSLEPDGVKITRNKTEVVAWIMPHLRGRDSFQTMFTPGSKVLGETKEFYSLEAAKYYVYCMWLEAERRKSL